MAYKPVQIFGFIMSFAYVFAGLLLLLTNFMEQTIADAQFRIFLGAALLVYGLFRVRYFLKQLRKKS
jgi:succinate-acetate transporter protein